MKNILNKMVQMQDQLNSKINPQWKHANFDWDTAITLESAELIDSLNWKWWANQENDWNNIKVEAVDLFHFILSKMINESQEHEFIRKFMESNAGIANKPKKDIVISLTKDIIFFTLQHTKQSNEMVIKVWMDLWAELGYKKEDILKEYLVKNTLNIFRQNHGYKDGSYKKMWNIGGIEAEDNVFAYRIANKIDLDENFSDNLTKELEEIYGN